MYFVYKITIMIDTALKQNSSMFTTLNAFDITN